MHVGGVSRVTDRAPTPGSEESEVPVQLQPMAATFKTRLRCSKLREALQEFVKLPLLAKVEFDYLDCSSDPTRSMLDIHSTILRDFAAKFKGALSTPVPLSEVSDLEDVAINCAESLVWKNLQSICEDARCCKGTASLCMIAKDLMWLLEDASHEVPLFVDAEANLRIWEVFVAANVQKQRFCALAVYEKQIRKQYTREKTVVESLMTTRLWDTMFVRFKRAQFHLAEHEMIDSDLQSQLKEFRDILSSVRSNLNLPASSLSCLTKLMRDLTAAASKIASFQNCQLSSSTQPFGRCRRQPRESYGPGRSGDPST